MAANWPVTIPYEALTGSLKVSPFRAPLATDMDDGQQRRRPSTTKNIATVGFVIPMDPTAFEEFKGFVRDTLVSGVLPFTMPIWTGADYEDRTCTFREPYEDDPGSGSMHQVTVNLDVEDY